MAIFFIGWELWQDMTFVLACCIVLVFLVGVLRLWLSNRRLRKHEVIDEERRQRLSEMRHCGIPAVRAPNDVPFGVRALESGVEVDGIWISRSNTPDPCRTPPCGTADADDDRHRQALVDRGQTVVDHRRTVVGHTLVDHGPGPGPSSRFHDDDDDDDDHISVVVAHPHPYAPRPLPRGWRPSLADPHLVTTDRPSSDFPVDAAPYGAAAVYANRNTRRLNAGFEVLPAGVLGPRHEFGPHAAADGFDFGFDADDVGRQASRLQKRPRG